MPSLVGSEMCIRDSIQRQSKEKMTEKTLLVENPFTFESNNKIFIQQIEDKIQEDKKQEESNEQIKDPYERLYNQATNNKKFGIIKALEEEAEKIAKAREESIYKDQQNKISWMANRNKSAKIWETDHDLKKQQYKIKNILKEKRETITEFIRKKKEITLTNLNIRNKQEETKRLEDFIQNEKESLNARKFYFSNDVQLVNEFMDQVKKAAEEATKEAEVQAKLKEHKKQEISQLTAQNEILDNQISRCNEELKTLKTYKLFIDEIKVYAFFFFFFLFILNKKKNNKVIKLTKQSIQPNLQKTCKKWINDMAETKRKEDQQLRKKIQEQNERKLKMQQQQQNQPSFLLTEIDKQVGATQQPPTDQQNNLSPNSQSLKNLQSQLENVQAQQQVLQQQQQLFQEKGNKKKDGEEESDDDFTIPFEPQQLIEILNQKETDNLQQIIIQTENQEELTKLQKMYQQLLAEKKLKEEQNKKRLDQLQEQKVVSLLY
eukprot:TRINITY_DN10775_c0_g1_i2.p1 TRINITY_DN10775_c0_g1~~TRINITY_DN10775_c0_g1_i2.p1  ORF type:complete len:490 (-),score=141.24 TRINITY_DN10775_c0_g1_i2:300-1769(-)